MKINRNNKFLFLGILLLLFLSYTLAIDKTLALKVESQKLEAQLAPFKDMPKKRSLLHQKEKYYDSILEKMDLMDTSVQNNLLRILNEEAAKAGVKIMDFNQPHITQRGENELYTFRFHLGGNYVDLLKVIHTVEQKGNFGEIIHIDFEKKKNYRTGKYGLEAMVLVQQAR
ncbi:MAG: hypothetical protein AAGA86_14535 [Bacteroidota bacterium]